MTTDYDTFTGTTYRDRYEKFQRTRVVEDLLTTDERCKEAAYRLDNENPYTKGTRDE